MTSSKNCKHEHTNKILSGKWSAKYIGPGMAFDRYRCLHYNEIGVRPPIYHSQRKDHETIDRHFDMPLTQKPILEKIEASLYLPNER